MVEKDLVTVARREGLVGCSAGQWLTGRSLHSSSSPYSSIIPFLLQFLSLPQSTSIHFLSLHSVLSQYPPLSLSLSFTLFLLFVSHHSLYPFIPLVPPLPLSILFIHIHPLDLPLHTTNIRRVFSTDWWREHRKTPMHATGTDPQDDKAVMDLQGGVRISGFGGGGGGGPHRNRTPA